MADLTLQLTKQEKSNATNIMLIALVLLLRQAMFKEFGVKLWESIMLVMMQAKIPNRD